MSVIFYPIKMFIAFVTNFSFWIGLSQSEKLTSIFFNCRCHLFLNNLFKLLRKRQRPIYLFNPFKLHEWAYLVKFPPHQIISFGQIDLEIFLLQMHVPKTGGRWLEMNAKHFGLSPILFQKHYHYATKGENG